MLLLVAWDLVVVSSNNLSLNNAITACTYLMHVVLLAVRLPAGLPPCTLLTLKGDVYSFLFLFYSLKYVNYDLVIISK